MRWLGPTPGKCEKESRLADYLRYLGRQIPGDNDLTVLEIAREWQAGKAARNRIGNMMEVR